MLSAKRLSFPLALLFSILLISPLYAEAVLNIPAEYGEIIYRFNIKSPNQIFIIGISHRDALTCLNGDNTAKVQAQIYEIGDWLIHHQGPELLLPEGFFKSSLTKVEKKNINAPDRGSNCANLDRVALVPSFRDLADAEMHDRTGTLSGNLFVVEHDLPLP